VPSNAPRHSAAVLKQLCQRFEKTQQLELPNRWMKALTA
jgi:hypothetical protein